MGGDSKPPMRNQGWAPSPPTPTSLTLGHPALEGGEVNRPTVGEQPWIKAQEGMVRILRPFAMIRVLSLAAAPIVGL